jgi:hypothetical protein
LSGRFNFMAMRGLQNDLMRVLSMLAALLIVVTADALMLDGEIMRVVVGTAFELGRGAKHEIAGVVPDILP